ncbi:tRNA (N6-isopentenyl adenosine(37)-C2)-methylthiotransferase MiaB [Peptoniphilus equinus]|uniref:tRNA-2-methylthio-N(6)-dimethylallyladenosine synthase n=1 Tax=Peptoniphilus equinus TaxID=3016343 RepID=A0ABY7QV96_9FIRM|nr:tRNA (N6-isopentenyl adenosine(37)-C2)-methylthiotransferase MiaB [Peptoniphilus equinus]WBW50702.1 tRNA (N6-isopentenyl adenosine(37)-C2)-methylthiotransferase MiaB [Peptoniphilus equinus]
MLDNLNLIEDYNTSVSRYIDLLRGEVQGKKACIITHGCQMNEHDSEKINWLLQKIGYEMVSSYEESDLVLVNTCSVRHSAEDKVYGQLGILKHLKSVKKDLICGVCGCMMQRQPSRDYVLDKFENVDLIFGTNNVWKLPELLYRYTQTGKLQIDIQEEKNPLNDAIGADRLYPFKSYVNIMYGCNNFCTYCIVPYTRGRETSRTAESICDEIRSLVHHGTKEVTLLGQNVNSYGKNLTTPVSFSELLRQIADIPDLARIRFMTSHPKDISNDLIQCFKELPNLSNFLHLPVQAGSNAVLQAMNRKYTREDYLRTIDKIKTVNPDIALCTDLMVGFPSETEADFQDTLDLVRQVEYDTSFTFIYSPREGTQAYNRADQVPDDVKHDRFQRLIDVLYPIQEKKNKAYIGKVVDVLVEDTSKKNPDRVVGRSDEFKLVNLTGSKELIGHIVPVKITHANSFNLGGELCQTKI